MKQVAVLGLWHLGLVSAAVLSDMGYTVSGFDSRPALMSGLKAGKLPLFEPGLDDLVKKNIAQKTLSLATDYRSAVMSSDTVLITYDTPVDDEDRVDLSLLNHCFQSILTHLRENALIIINSQIPVGTTEEWQRQAEVLRTGANIDVISSPENIRLGQAIDLFRKPDMIVIGVTSPRARKKAEAFYEPFPSEKFFVSPRTAEMAKHAINAFLATSISFANEIGNLCDALGADGMEIAKILKKDSRIGAKAQVRPGLGFAGATLARDLRGLQELGRKYRVPTILADSVLAINLKQIHQIVSLIEKRFHHKLHGKVITVLGLTYKPGTSTLRRSSSVEIIHLLHERGAVIKAHDPKADISELSGEREFEFFQDPYEACRMSQCLLLVTEWPEYRELDFSKIKILMSQEQPFLVDTKNHLKADEIEYSGLGYIQIGRGQLTPFTEIPS